MQVREALASMQGLLREALRHDAAAGLPVDEVEMSDSDSGRSDSDLPIS